MLLPRSFVYQCILFFCLPLVFNFFFLWFTSLGMYSRWQTLHQLWFIYQTQRKGSIIRRTDTRNLSLIFFIFYMQPQIPSYLIKLHIHTHTLISCLYSRTLGSARLYSTPFFAAGADFFHSYIFAQIMHSQWMNQFYSLFIDVVKYFSISYEWHLVESMNQFVFA